MTTTDMELSEEQINHIIDSDPSDNKMYIKWMMQEVSRGTNMDTIVDVINKMWKKKTPIPINQTINEILSSDVPEIKNYITDCKLLYYKNNLLVVRVMDQTAPILKKCEHWTEDFINYEKDSKERTRPVFIFINLSETEKKPFSFIPFWNKKEEPSLLRSCLVVSCLGESSNKIFPLNEIVVPESIKKDKNGKEFPEEILQRIIHTYYFAELGKTQREWLKNDEIAEAIEKENIPYHKYFFNKELLNFHINEFWQFFPCKFSDKQEIGTNPWIVEHYTAKIEALKKQMSPEQGYTDIQKATLEKIIMEMEAIILHVKNLQQEIYRRPKLPE